MAKRSNLFPTPLWEEEDCGVDLQPLVDFCYHVKQEDPEGRRASNGGGGWQSSDFRLPFLLTTPLKELHDRIIQQAYASMDDWGFNSYSLHLSNMWININNKKHFNYTHTHPGSLLSGVFYAKVPQCCSGDLRIIRDLHEQNLKEAGMVNNNLDRWENPANSDECMVTPKENKLAIFPAWLAHSVDPSSSDDDRISLSFNIHAFSDFLRDDQVYPTQQPINTRLSV